MADDIVGGLFGIRPDMYQQQQQKQVFDRAVAMQNLNPFQQASVGLQQGGYNLAGALGGALGGVDPQLQRISALNAISKQIDQSNPESMLQGAKMLADAGFQQEALGLAQYARKANSELALAQQRMKEGRAAAVPKEVQIAEYVSTVKTQLGQLQAMEQTPDVVNAINILQSRLDALPQPKEAAQNADIVKAQRIGELVGQIDVLKSLPEAQQNPALIRQLDAQLASLSGGSNKVSNFAQQLIDRGFKPGSPEFNSRMDDYITKETTLPASSDRAPPSVGGDAERISQTLYGKRFSELSKAEAAVVDAEVERRDLAGKKASAASLKVEIPLGDAMTKALGMGEKNEQAKAWGAAGESYKAAIPMIDKLSQVKNSLSSTFTGAGADAKLAFSKGLAAFGIPVNVNEIGKAEYFNAVSSQLVQAIARVFPGSQSNKELDQLLKSKPNAYQEIPTILRLIGQIQDEMIASTKAYEKLDALGVDGRSKANPAILEGQVYTKLKRYRALEAQATSGKPMKQSDIDEAKKLQQELGVQ